MWQSESIHPLIASSLCSVGASTSTACGHLAQPCPRLKKVVPLIIIILEGRCKTSNTKHLRVISLSYFYLHSETQWVLWRGKEALQPPTRWEWVREARSTVMVVNWDKRPAGEEYLVYCKCLSWNPEVRFWSLFSFDVVLVLVGVVLYEVGA